MRCPHCRRVGYQPSLDEAFAMNVRSRRLAQKRTQAELAEAAGIHQSKLNMIERLARSPQLTECVRLAQALGTTVEMLFEMPPDKAEPAFKHTATRVKGSK